MKIEMTSFLADCPIADDFGNLYLISDVDFPSRKTRKLQRIVLSPDNDIIKNDVYKSQEKELWEISKVLYHHGKIYVISLWQGNKKERELHEAKERTGEIPGRLLPIEELDVYDLEKADTYMKTGLTIIEAK